MLSIKLYLGYKRVQRNAIKYIKIGKQAIIAEAEYSKDWKQVESEQRYWIKGQLDNIAEELQYRGLSLYTNN